MELEYSLTCQQESTTCPWPEPDDNFSTTPNFFMITLSTLGSILVLSYCLHLSFKQYLSFRFPCQSLVYVSLLYTFCPAWFDHSNNTQIDKSWSSLRRSFFTAFWYIIPLCHKWFPQHPVLTHFLCSFLKLSDQFSHSYKTKGKVTILYISVVMFLVSKLEDKTFWTDR
jgi:hypothetical protein